MIDSSLLEALRIRHRPIYGAGWTPIALRLDAVRTAAPAEALSPAQMENILDALPIPVRLCIPIRCAEQWQAFAKWHAPTGTIYELAPDWTRAVDHPALVAQAKANDTQVWLRFGSEATPPHEAEASLPSVGAYPHCSVREISGALEDYQAAFAGGAKFVLGWPQGRSRPGGSAAAAVGGAELRSTLELLRRIDADEPVGKIVEVIEGSPDLALRFLRLLNSASVGLRGGATSVRHGVMMLGFAQLRKWVALLAIHAVDNPELQPLVHKSTWRAYFLQQLGQALGSDSAGGDLFICGAFSLLEDLLGEPMKAIIADVPLAKEVEDCLLLGRGPYAGFLQLALAVELPGAGDPHEIAATLSLTPGEVNRATMGALATAFA
jgi:hypothetical protein